MRAEPSLVVLGLIVVLCFAAHADGPVPADLVGTLPGSAGRLIVWKVGEKQYGTVQPARVALAKAPGDVKPALGLTHLGYSGEDPDGKSATLTFTVVLTQQPVTKGDKAVLAGKDITLKED